MPGALEAENCVVTSARTAKYGHGLRTHHNASELGSYTCTLVRKAREVFGMSQARKPGLMTVAEGPVCRTPDRRRSQSGPDAGLKLT